jgi:heme/copper-type cytochrome/quinol oxidase subunit 2
MRALTVAAAILTLLATSARPSENHPPAPVQAQTAARPQAQFDTLTPEQARSVKELTGLFMVLVIMLLLAVIATILVSLMLRRRLKLLEDKQARTVTELEDLWAKAGRLNPFDDKKKRL